MDLAERMQRVAERVSSHIDQLNTEEATKTSLVLPFIQALGYDVFDPSQVVPEFVADVGIKKKEKIDYAIMVAGEPCILIECKRIGAPLPKHDSQLFRYFGTSEAKIAILTDGVHYNFYTDLAAQNRMDETPFLTFDIRHLDKSAIRVLESISRDSYNLDGILNTAVDLRDRAIVKAIIAESMIEPSDEVVRVFADKANAGRLTASVLDRYRGLVTAAFREFIAETVEQRLKRALDTNDSVTADQSSTQADESSDVEDDVVTTVEELEGYYIVKAILGQDVDPTRVVSRDVRSYFGILLDDNNRKPICRLHFNAKQKYLGLFDSAKQETRLPIDTPHCIYKHADALRESLRHVLPATSEP